MAKVAVFESVAIAFGGDDFGVVHEAVVASGRAARDVAASLGIAESCPYRWKSGDLIDRGVKPGTTSKSAGAGRRVATHPRTGGRGQGSFLLDLDKCSLVEPSTVGRASTQASVALGK